MTNSLRKNLLALAVFNAAKLISEQQAAPQPPAPQDPMAPGASVPGPEAQPVPGQAPPSGEELTVDTLIAKLNKIRAGRSFSDPDIYSKLTAMFNTIPQEQQPQFFKMLDDIGAAVQPTPNDQQLAQGQPPTPDMAAAPPPPATPAAPAQPPPPAAPMV